MAGQVPQGAVGTAVGVLVWSVICLISNCFFIWLLWGGRERRSFIFLLSWVALIATLSSITSQIYAALHYEDLMVARLRAIRKNPTNPLLVATDGRLGADLALWLIRWVCFITESGLSCFWAFTLAQAVYGWRDNPRLRRGLIIISELGKPFAILAAIISVCALLSKKLQQSQKAWGFVLNFLYAAFLLVALFMFFIIFVEYIQTRLLFRRMNREQRREYTWQPSDDISNRSRSTSISTSTTLRADTGSNFGALQQREGGIYDKYLILRTFIPLFLLCVFEVWNIQSYTALFGTILAVSKTTAPDLSAATARSWFVSHMPGCLASLILPLAFATTRNFSQRIYQTLVPRRLQSFERRRRFRRTAEFTYVGMDVDKGMLSRQKRLSMEKRLRIEVTYEFEVRTEESVAAAVGNGDKGAMRGGGGKSMGISMSLSPSPIPSMSTMKSHCGEDDDDGVRIHGISAGRQGSSTGDGDMDRILPRKPGMTVLKKDGFRM
ncbi:hypothetical protein BD289DRAFT_289567 [Coniella lustricola]|uniref:Uncharacterized protein n=1 Tax=Coniella lustricola TaxID=2025994 RepID=A0A2T3A5F8_9PEZI|nr:hypothetical protein BD289DRAFT_289567 [Coniella lustricola]